MAGHFPSLLLQLYVLLMLVQPLSHSDRPERYTCTSGPLLEDMELQEVEPELTSWMDMAMLSWMCFFVELLISGIFLGCWLRRRLQRRWKKEKCQSPSDGAEPCCCQGHGCPRKLIQLLKDNRDLLQLCLRHSPQTRPRAKKAAKWGNWKRRRLLASRLR